MIYEITIEGNDSYTLQYELNDNSPTKTWLSLTQETSVDNLRKSLNPWQGQTSQYNQVVNDLMLVISELNSWLPSKIKNSWDFNRPVQSLNELHAHFPDNWSQEPSSEHREQLTRFNDLIHCLELIIVNKTKNIDLLYLLICCDTSKKVEIKQEEFNFFTSEVNFGDLTLHYCHVGRHPFEVFLSNDLDCPSDQIIPQYSISSYHTLRFHSYINCARLFKNFYYKSKIQWPYMLDDKRLAFGYIPLGKLTTINNKIYKSEKDITNIINSCNKILDWQFK